MIYAVSKFQDWIKPRKEPHDGNYADQYVYFHSENEARAFIRKRSVEAYYEAEAAVEKARKRHNRNCKKYPPIKDESPAAGQNTKESK